MSEIERMTVTMPADMAALIKAAVEGGDYASTSEVVRDALRDWKMKRALQQQQLTQLRSDIKEGLNSSPAGELDADSINRRGRERLTATKSR